MLGEGRFGMRTKHGHLGLGASSHGEGQCRDGGVEVGGAVEGAAVATARSVGRVPVNAKPVSERETQEPDATPNLSAIVHVHVHVHGAWWRRKAGPQWATAL